MLTWSYCSILARFQTILPHPSKKTVNHHKKTSSDLVWFTAHFFGTTWNNYNVHSFSFISYHVWDDDPNKQLVTLGWPRSTCAKEGPGQAVEENLSSHRSCLCKMCEAEMMPGQVRRREIPMNQPIELETEFPECSDNTYIKCCVCACGLAYLCADRYFFLVCVYVIAQTNQMHQHAHTLCSNMLCQHDCSATSSIATICGCSEVR